MKFQLAINLERHSENISMEEVRDHTMDMVKMADQAGFNIVWSAEHHALEMTIAPDPFQLLTWWSTQTKNIRLGTGVVAAPYWHPIKLAGEAAMTDVGITGGGKGNNMLYLSGVQSKKVLTNEIIDKVVAEVEKKALELEKE